jgi:putative nucleotidyltransferase with HDIG domain
VETTRLLGRLRFRHSYSQNILDHSIEVARLAGLIAAELGDDIEAAKRAGLLHDIGKAVTHEMEGPHALVGAELLRQHGEDPRIVNAVASHHQEVESEAPLGVIVSAADAISASRPGARSETMSTYLKRVENLERLGASFRRGGEMLRRPSGPRTAGPGPPRPIGRRRMLPPGPGHLPQDRGRTPVPRPDPRHARPRNPLRTRSTRSRTRAPFG